MEDLLHLISCKGRGRGRTGALAGGFRSICEAKDGSERSKDGSRFVSLYSCLLLWKTPFAPPLAFVSETVQDRTMLLNRERWKCIIVSLLCFVCCIWKTLSCSFHVKEETT
jgi:hypothetical protein